MAVEATDSPKVDWGADKAAHRSLTVKCDRDGPDQVFGTRLGAFRSLHQLGDAAMPSTSTVVDIIDDDDGLRESLAFLLRSAEMEVRSYATAKAFLDALPGAPLNCVISDVRMPGMSGIDLLQHLKALDIDVPVIVITGHGDIPLAVEAMKFGAADFFEKPFDDELLLASVRSIVRQQEDATKRYAERAEIERRIAALSRREHDVLSALVNGRMNKQIAFDLGISPRTVEIYRANLMKKMQF
jgi:two-component system, LuxR family, response regulator FixJ